jgi:DNA invertase Pin-like site-specific DNA recombinase
MACGASADVATRIEDEVASGGFDLVLVDSLSRISRRHHRLFALTKACIDHGTRLISAHDGLDTADRNVIVSVSLFALMSDLAILDHRRSRARRSAKSRRNAKH